MVSICFTLGYNLVDRNGRAAELLVSISPAKRKMASAGGSSQPYAVPSSHPASISSDKHPQVLHLQPLSPAQIAEELEFQGSEQDELSLGKTLMDNKQYTRACEVLEHVRSAKGLFLKTYSQFLVSFCDAVRAQTFNNE